MNETIEQLVVEDVMYGILVRSAHQPSSTSFVTLPESPQQVGHIVYPKGGAIPRHYHRPVKRQLVGTSEIILVKKGRCIVTFYDQDRIPVLSRTLDTGDLLFIIASDGQGHGFEMLENTVLLDIKQGPYTGDIEKALF